MGFAKYISTVKFIGDPDLPDLPANEKFLAWSTDGGAELILAWDDAGGTETLISWSD